MPLHSLVINSTYGAWCNSTEGWRAALWSFQATPAGLIPRGMLPLLGVQILPLGVLQLAFYQLPIQRRVSKEAPLLHLWTCIFPHNSLVLGQSEVFILRKSLFLVLLSVLHRSYAGVKQKQCAFAAENFSSFAQGLTQPQMPRVQVPSTRFSQMPMTKKEPQWQPNMPGIYPLHSNRNNATNNRRTGYLQTSGLQIQNKQIKQIVARGSGQKSHLFSKAAEHVTFPDELSMRWQVFISWPLFRGQH